MHIFANFVQNLMDFHDAGVERFVTKLSTFSVKAKLILIMTTCHKKLQMTSALELEKSFDISVISQYSVRFFGIYCSKHRTYIDFD